jgi:hypothetical protein
LPRGLGENPLKREKKRTRRTASAVLVTVPTVDAAAETVATETVQDAGASSRSYNDVFFQRRPEEADASAAPIAAAITTPEVSTDYHFAIAAPTAALAETYSSPSLSEPSSSYFPEVASVPEVASLETVTASPTEPILTAIPVPEIVAPAEQPVHESEVSTEQVVPEPAASSEQPQVLAQTTIEAKTPAASEPASEPKSGFFGRIFGKLRKS